jgi:hypothetical protein
MQKKEIRHLSLTRININSRWIKDLHVMPENFGGLQDIGMSKDVLDKTLKAQEIKAKRHGITSC